MDTNMHTHPYRHTVYCMYTNKQAHTYTTHKSNKISWINYVLKIIVSITSIEPQRYFEPGAWLRNLVQFWAEAWNSGSQGVS